MAISSPSALRMMPATAIPPAPLLLPTIPRISPTTAQGSVRKREQLTKNRHDAQNQGGDGIAVPRRALHGGRGIIRRRIPVLLLIIGVGLLRLPGLLPVICVPGLRAVTRRICSAGRRLIGRRSRPVRAGCSCFLDKGSLAEPAASQAAAAGKAYHLARKAGRWAPPASDRRCRTENHRSYTFCPFRGSRRCRRRRDFRFSGRVTTG